MEAETKLVELWAIVELFGHQKMAGQVSEQVMGGTFIRVDVPTTSTQPGYSRLVNPSAVYALNPVSETVARMMAEDYRQSHWRLGILSRWSRSYSP